MYEFLEEYGNVVAAAIVCAAGGFVIHTLSIWIMLTESTMISNFI